MTSVADPRSRLPQRPAWALALERSWVVLLVMGGAWLLTSGAIGLLEPTETRYAEIAREMRASGDYLVPRLNGVQHFHKPPLAYWMTTLGFRVFGENAWGARVPTALAAIATLALLIPIARRGFGALRIDPAHAMWLMGTMPLGFFLGRSVATDPYLTAAVTAFWALAPSPWAIAALGVGFLAKGPVVLVPTLLPILAVAALARDRIVLRRIGPAWGWLLFAALALPWYLVIAARTPGLLGYLLHNQIYERYATNVYHRPGPPWYFAGVLVAGSLPWIAALIAGLGRLWRERTSPEARLLLAWLVVPLAFFSFSGSKLPAYILPCLPAAALIAARGFDAGGRTVRWTTAGLLVAMAIAGWVLGPPAFGRLIAGPGAAPAALGFPMHFALACLLYAATWVLRARPAPAALLVALALTSLAIAVAPVESRIGSARPLARMLAENRSPGEPVIEFKRFNAGIPFYLGETVRMLEVPRETAFEDSARHPTVFVTRDTLVSLAASGRRVWIVGPREASVGLAESLGLRYSPLTGSKRESVGFITR